MNFVDNKPNTQMSLKMNKVESLMSTKLWKTESNKLNFNMPIAQDSVESYKDNALQDATPTRVREILDTHKADSAEPVNTIDDSNFKKEADKAKTDFFNI